MRTMHFLRVALIAASALAVTTGASAISAGGGHASGGHASSSGHSSGSSGGHATSAGMSAAHGVSESVSSGHGQGTVVPRASVPGVAGRWTSTSSAPGSVTYSGLSVAAGAVRAKPAWTPPPPSVGRFVAQPAGVSSQLSQPYPGASSAGLGNAAGYNPTDEGYWSTARLIWLLARPALTSHDRRWAEDRLAERAAQPMPVDKLDAGVVDRSISFAGLPKEPVPVGKPVEITILASNDVQALTVGCTIDGAELQSDAPPLTFTWTPSAAGAQLLKCTAGDHAARAVVRVAEKARAQGK